MFASRKLQYLDDVRVSLYRGSVRTWDWKHPASQRSLGWWGRDASSSFSSDAAWVGGVLMRDAPPVDGEFDFSWTCQAMDVSAMLYCIVEYFVVLCYAVPCSAVLYCGVLRCTVVSCTVQCGAVLWSTSLYCAVLYRAVRCCIVEYFVVLCCAVPCSAVLYCGVLRCTVLCCTVQCGAVLGCAVLCRALPSWVGFVKARLG